MRNKQQAQEVGVPAPSNVGPLMRTLLASSIDPVSDEWGSGCARKLDWVECP